MEIGSQLRLTNLALSLQYPAFMRLGIVIFGHAGCTTCTGMEQETDEAIAARVQAGDAEAFGILMKRYEAKLLRYARTFLQRSDDAELMVQDVFIKAYMSIQSFRAQERFSPWIYRIAHNTFVNELRRQTYYPVAWFATDVLFPQLAGEERADTLALTRERVAEVATVLTQIPPAAREILVLHYFEELSYQEISDVLRIPVSTVGVRLLRARKVIANLLSEKE